MSSIDMALRHHYFSVRALQSLAPGTKTFRKALRALQKEVDFHIRRDINNAKPGSAIYPYHKKQRLYMALMLIFITLSLITTILMILFGGDQEVQAFTPEETRAFFSWLALLAIWYSLVFGVCMLSNRSLGAYLYNAVRRFDPDTEGIDDAELKSMIYAMNDLKDDAYEKAGCLKCYHIFTIDKEAAWDPERACPVCGCQILIGEGPDFPITETYLKKARRYWTDAILE